MLTKELFVHRTVKGSLRPSFLNPKDKEWTQLADAMLAEAAVAAGGPYGALEDALLALARGQSTAARVKRARGLLKTLMDKVEVEDVDPAAAERRQMLFADSASALAGLDDGASEEDFEAVLAAKHDTLDTLRAELYADLPAARRVVAVPEWSTALLIDRYNLGLAQGLLLYSQSLTLRLKSADVVALRNLLRWMKWCRLVAEIDRKGEELILRVDGPASVLDSSRKYGLQLAQFLAGVVRLPQFLLEAEICLPRKKPAVLALSESNHLVSSLPPAKGHVPEELSSLGRRFASGPWRVEQSSGLRSVGARGVCVPDFELVHAERGQVVAVELFHSWHKGALGRRLDELQQVADPELVLGVDKKLVKNDPEMQQRLDARSASFVFQSFPTARALSQCLEKSFNPS